MLCGACNRATAWFAGRGITVERVLTDNAWAYTKSTWRSTCVELDLGPRWIRPLLPQANGKVERFNRILLEEWAYARPYRSETEKREAFQGWLHDYNHHRFHTAISGPPASRVPNLSGQYT